ncbi:uncharacterized protein [Haliotis asinina]|uniref:uncharacterized protein n=1 Tax=Haliotis asinina TaxID=109174 RepID=UPI0035319869
MSCWSRLGVLLYLSSLVARTKGVGVVIGPVNCPQHPTATRHSHYSITNRCYYYYDAEYTYHEAVSLCESENTRVVVLRTRGEQDWLIGRICDPRGSCNRPLILWLGLVRQASNTWYWFYKSYQWDVFSPRWLRLSDSASPGYTRAVTDRDGKWRAVTRDQRAKVVCEEVKSEDMPRLRSTSQSPPPATLTPIIPQTPSTCAKVGQETDDIAVTNFEQLSSSVWVVEMNVTSKSSRLACAMTCSKEERCVMFKKQPGGREPCYMYSLSNNGSPADCVGNPPPCYWKSCWRPTL